jgi:MshEN domain
VPILARVLRDRGIITESQLQEAIQHQVLYGGRLGTNLHELGFITEERLREALSRAHGVPTVEVDPREISPEVLALVPRALAARSKVFPYRLRGKTLFLLMVDPNDHGTVARIGYSREYIVKPLVVPEFRMVQLLSDYYGVDARWRFDDTRRPSPPPPGPPEPAAAGARLDAALTRDEVVEALLSLCLGFFKRVVFFIVREPWVLGWTGGGEGMDRSLAASLRIPLDRPSVFRTVTRGRTVFIGRLGSDEEDLSFLKLLGKRPTANAALVPVAVKGRVVNLIYGDSVSGSIKPRIGDLMVTLQKAPRAYLRIIRKRIEEAKSGEPGASDSPGRSER